MPSAAEIETNGQAVGEIQIKQQKQIEENVLYILELKKEITNIKNENAEIKNEIKKLKSKK